MSRKHPAEVIQRAVWVAIESGRPVARDLGLPSETRSRGTFATVAVATFPRCQRATSELAAAVGGRIRAAAAAVGWRIAPASGSGVGRPHG
jgi:hypothetical protein